MTKSLKYVKNEKCEMLDDAGLTRIVTYSNGVKVYLNYGHEETTISGVKVAAQSFVVE